MSLLNKLQTAGHVADVESRQPLVRYKHTRVRSFSFPYVDSNGSQKLFEFKDHLITFYSEAEHELFLETAGKALDRIDLADIIEIPIDAPVKTLGSIATRGPTQTKDIQSPVVNADGTPVVDDGQQPPAAPSGASGLSGMFKTT